MKRPSMFILGLGLVIAGCLAWAISGVAHRPSLGASTFNPPEDEALPAVGTVEPAAVSALTDRSVDAKRDSDFAETVGDVDAVSRVSVESFSRDDAKAIATGNASRLTLTEEQRLRISEVLAQTTVIFDDAKRTHDKVFVEAVRSKLARSDFVRVAPNESIDCDDDGSTTLWPLPDGGKAKVVVRPGDSPRFDDAALRLEQLSDDRTDAVLAVLRETSARRN